MAYGHSRLVGARAPLDAAPWIERGLSLAAQALQRDPQNARALELRGTLRYWRWLLHLAPDPKEAAALLQNAERDLRAAVGLTPSLASAWSTLSHLDNQKNDLTQAKIDAQRAYEEDAYLRVADQVVWRLFTTSYDLEQSQDAIHWCAEGHRRFAKNPKFTQCQLWAMTLRDVAPDIPRAWRVVDELRAITSERQWQFDGPMAKILVCGGLARPGWGGSGPHLLPRSPLDPGSDLQRGVGSYHAV